MKNKRQDIFQFTGVLLILVLLNFIASVKHMRIDLSKEGRYSLSESTKNMLAKLDDYIYVEVYLEGDFPAGIERLSMETRQILTEFKNQNNLLQYTFINPTESTDETTRNEIIKQLYDKGLSPTNLQVKEGDSYTEKVIIPGAIVKLGGKEVAVQLLKNQIAAGPEQSLEQSITELEYEFAYAIKQLKNDFKPSIAFITGHGELEDRELEDLTKSLSNQYSVDKINLREFEMDSLGEANLKQKLNELKRKKLLLIAKPKYAFQNLDQYFIDQYIMAGGKVIWMLDATNADMDSLANKGTFLALPLRDLNLGEQLFKYGARLNSDLIEDISSSKIPVPVNFINDMPQWELRPWRYFPICIPTSKPSHYKQFKRSKT